VRNVGVPRKERKHNVERDSGEGSFEIEKDVHVPAIGKGQSLMSSEKNGADSL